MKTKKLFWVAVLFMAMNLLKADGISWRDEFDDIDVKRWITVPETAVIMPKDTLSAANRVARITPPERYQQFFLSRDRFLNGDLEMSFCLNRPSKGETFYYLGFHDNEPWLKSICWIMIQDGLATFGFKSIDGATVSQELCHLSNGDYHTLIMTQSTGKITVTLDDVHYEFTDPALLANPNAMPLFFSAYTREGTVEPAELRIDYVKVSGGIPKGRLVARELSDREYASLPESLQGRIETNDSAMAWNMAGGLHWGAIEREGSQLLDPNVFIPCFALDIDGAICYSHEMEIVSTDNRENTFRAVVRDSQSGVEAVLTASALDYSAMTSRLVVTNRGEETHRVQTIFPIVGSLAPSGDWQQTKYFFPWRGGLLGEVTGSFKTEYGSFANMQVMAAYDPQGGNGVYFFSEDASGNFKAFTMLKQKHDEPMVTRHSELVIPAEQPTQLELLERQDGVVMAQAFRSQVLAKGESSETPPVRFATWNGNWKTPLTVYSQWMRAHLRPVTVPRWFKDSFACQNAHPPFYYDEATGRYIGHERMTGAEDVIQIAFWDAPVPDKKLEKPLLGIYQPGDFYPSEWRGGTRALAKEVAETQAKGTNYTLYIDHRFCWQDTETGKASGAAWSTMSKDGKLLGYTGDDDLYMCCFYDTDKWVEHMRNSCARLTRDLGLNGIYLDELGVAFECYNPNHDHTQKGFAPTYPAGLGRAITSVRQAMQAENPQAALMTEHPGSDYLTQFFDGSWDQTFYDGAFGFVEKYFDELHVCFFHFYFPYFKLSEWGCSKLHAKRCLFNGIGMDLGGAQNTDEIRVYSRAMRENNDAIGSLDIEPIVAVSNPKLLANRFTGPDKIVYTLFNDTEEDQTGSILDFQPGTLQGHFVECIRDEAVPADEDGRPLVTVPAGQVAMVVCLPERLTIDFDNNYVIFPEGCEVIVCENTDDEHFLPPRGTSVTMKHGGKYQARTAGAKLIFKLKKDGYLIDEVIK